MIHTSERRSGKNCPESDGMVSFMTFSGLSSHNMLALYKKIHTQEDK